MDCIVANEMFDIINNILDDRKKTKNFRGITLTNTELRMINYISKHKEDNSLDISKRESVTKAAITHISSKLIKKELIETYNKKGNKKEKYFRLTDLGKKVNGLYEKEYLESNQKLCNYISKLSKKEKEIIIDFLNILKENNINEFICLRGEEKCWN